MGAAASAQTKDVLSIEASKPADASDVEGAAAVEEVKRLRALFHQFSGVNYQEQKGLEVVWGMIAQEQQTIDVPTLVEAYQKMTHAPISEEGMRGMLKELAVAENAIDFDCFVKIFALRKRHGPKVTFNDLDKSGKGEITAHDLRTALEARPTFAAMDFDEALSEEIINLASPTGKVQKEHFGNLEQILDKKKKVYEAFKLWDSNGDGQVDIRDILQTLKSHGEDMTMEEAKEILAECDIDKDGVINFRDFAAAIERPSFDALEIGAAAAA